MDKLTAEQIKEAVAWSWREYRFEVKGRTREDIHAGALRYAERMGWTNIWAASWEEWDQIMAQVDELWRWVHP